MEQSDRRKSDLKKQVMKERLIALAIAVLVLIAAFVFLVNKFKSKGEEKPTTTDAPKTTLTEAPTTLPPTPMGDISDTKKGAYFNNTVPAYYSDNVLVCGDFALELFGGTKSESYAAAVSAFAEKYPNVNVSCAIIPKSSAFYIPVDLAPSLSDSICEQIKNQNTIQTGFITNTYALMNDRVKKVDVMGEMNRHADEYMFYRTDHHWNSLGAYYASVAFCNTNGITPRSVYDYETVRKDDYVGSMYAFCGEPKPECLRSNPDYTIGRLPKAEYTMHYTRDGVSYEARAINGDSEGYMMFLCGDQPFTEIKTNLGTGRKLLIFKESFGNAFAPYMIDYFDEVYVVDIREDAPSTASLIAEKGITDVLFINNILAASDSTQIERIQGKIDS